MKIGRDTLLGLMFFVGLGLLILATVFLSELALGRTREIPIYFETAIGLKAGDPVNVVGVKKGYVHSIDFVPDNPRERRVLVKIQLARDVMIRKDFKVVIEFASLLGGRIVALDPGFPGGEPIPLDREHPLQGTVVKDPIQSFTELIDDEQSKLNKALSSIRDTFEAAARGQGVIAKILNDPELAKKVDRIATNIDELVQAANRGEGALGVLLRDRESEQRIKNIIKDLESVAAKLDRGDAPISRLLSDKELGAKLDRIISNIDDLTGKLARGEGSLGKLVVSSEAHDKLVRIFDSAQLALDKVNAGQGLLGKLVSDEGLATDAKEGIRAFKELLAGANRGEGTIGRLFKDDTLVRNLERLVRQFGRLIEDAREAAPVSTFGSVLFGAF